MSNAGASCNDIPSVIPTTAQYKLHMVFMAFTDSTVQEIFNMLSYRSNR